MDVTCQANGCKITGRVTELVFLLMLATGCVRRGPERTERPVVPLDPWTEETVQSEVSGQTYRFLFLSGPSEDAPNMVLLPGGFFDTRIWLYFHGLSAHFNLYALDWPDSSPFYNGRVENGGDVAADFLNAVGVTKLHVTGISAGAYSAIELATNQPQLQVESLVLISSVMFAVSKKEVRKRRRGTGIALRLKPDRMRAIAERIAMKNKYNRAPGTVQQRDIFWVRPYSYYRQVFEMTANQKDRKQKTDKVPVPVLFFHGTEDEIIDYRVARENHTMFPNAEFITIEGGRHSMAFSRGPKLTKMITTHHRRRGLLD